LEIKPEPASQRTQTDREQKKSNKVLADFSTLVQLRVLGLMDVTTTFVPNIPDESEDRRVRTSVSVVNKMAYGIADNLGRDDSLKMLDLVQPEFMEKKDEAIFALFGRCQSTAGHNVLNKFLHDHFLTVFSSQLTALDASKNETVPDAIRRSFLKLNKLLYDELYSLSSAGRKLSQASGSMVGKILGLEGSSLRCGASGIVLYLVDKTLYVANAGDALAVISRQGSAHAVATKHDPFDRSEIARIRAAEGWVSPKGLVNDEIDTSRSFGFYHLLPVINARPDICTWSLSESDEFVIVGNRGLWDYVSYQTAVDIARSEPDPMIAAQKLRDFAISYGTVECTTIMVIRVGDLFDTRTRQPTLDSIVDPDIYSSLGKVRRRKDDISDRTISRLDGEVSPPIGHLALVFTDIRNSTHLWEANAGMPSAMRLHNHLLRRQLRLCGGYEVKTEGDAFMCSFPTTLAALWWCLAVQVQLLNEPWPLEVLECDDGRELYDKQGQLVCRGLSVRMGLHCGSPLCEPDPITHRMDYFGSMVNRSSRISGSANGGQIMCSADVIREINARIFENESWTEYSEYQPLQAINAIRRIGLTVVPVGETKLKGLEVPEMLSLVYPAELAGRHDMEGAEVEPSASGSRVQLNVQQIRDLGNLCLRLEALSSLRIFRPLPERKKSSQKSFTEGQPDETEQRVAEPESRYMYGDPNLLLPNLSDRATDAELMAVLDSLSLRIDNAAETLFRRISDKRRVQGAISALERHAGLDETTLRLVASILQSM
jgi:adenylate cyclase